MKRNLNIFLLLFLLLLCLPATIAAAFSDVKSSRLVLAADVGDMTAEGLICGYPDGTFRPGRTITGGGVRSPSWGQCGGLEPAASSSSHWGRRDHAGGVGGGVV